MNTLNVFYLVAIWFFVLSFVSKGDRLYAAILFLFSVFNIVILDLFNFTDGFKYEDYKEILIKLDGTAALIMTFVMIKERQATNQALILIFMVLCHTMILLHLITDSYIMWAISKPFYAVYNELIIMSALLQIWVSRDGMAKGLNNALRGLQSMLFSFIFHYHRISKSLSERKKIKGGT